MDDDLRHFLKNTDIKLCKGSPTLSGTADAGHALGTWPGRYVMVLSAMEDHQTERVIARVKDFRDQWVQSEGEAKIPMRVLAIPCERIS